MRPRTPSTSSRPRTATTRTSPSAPAPSRRRMTITCLKPPPMKPWLRSLPEGRAGSAAKDAQGDEWRRTQRRLAATWYNLESWNERLEVNGAPAGDELRRRTALEALRRGVTVPSAPTRKPPDGDRRGRRGARKKIMTSPRRGRSGRHERCSASETSTRCAPTCRHLSRHFGACRSGFDEENGARRGSNPRMRCVMLLWGMASTLPPACVWTRLLRAGTLCSIQREPAPTPLLPTLDRSKPNILTRAPPSCSTRT